MNVCTLYNEVECTHESHVTHVTATVSDDSLTFGGWCRGGQWQTQRDTPAPQTHDGERRWVPDPTGTLTQEQPEWAWLLSVRTIPDCKGIYT